MNCIDKAELELYLKGKLDIERLLAVDAHLSTCTSCKTALQGLPAQQKAGAALGANLLGLQECPEYEALSAYVDGKLAADEAGAIRVHANLCEECARDIARIEELRAHASLRERVEVFPGMSRQAGRSAFGYWKQAAAVLSGAAVVAAVALSVANIGTRPGNPSQVANGKPPAHNAPSSGNQIASNDNQPVQPFDRPDTTKPVDNNGIQTGKPDNAAPSTGSPSHVTKPEAQHATVLKDGKYRVIEKNGAYEMATADGAPVRTKLEARIAASIREKLRTGKIKQAASYEVASAAFGVRSGVVTISPSAPELHSPLNKVVLTGKPVLKWSGSDMAESYLVTIYDKSGREVISETTKETTFTPSEPLARGMVYTWRVGVRFNESDDWARSKAGKFSVLSAQDYETIQKLKAQGSHLALGAAYEYFGLFDEAAAEYRAVVRENPHSKLANRLEVDSPRE